jgi:hypothetical protein
MHAKYGDNLMMILFIPLLPQNPNFFMGYDAEIV